MFRNYSQKVAQKAKQYKTSVVAAAGSLAFTAMSAHAELPSGVATAFTGLQTDGTALFNIAFPIVLVFIGFTVIMKLTKRYSNKL